MTRYSGSRGFTLIEIVIYVVILSVIALIMVGVLTAVTRIGSRESSSAEVTGQLNFVIQTVGRLVRSSSYIDMPTGVGTSTMTLRMPDPSQDPTLISLGGGVITIKQGVSPATPLTNSKVIVNFLNFQKTSQYPGHDTVAIDLTMTYNSPNPVNQIQRSLSSAIARVSAAAFDSDLLPGSDNTFDVGYGALPRWRNGAFSGNLLVNGLVGIGTTNPTNKLHIWGSNPGVLLNNDTGNAGTSELGFAEGIYPPHVAIFSAADGGYMRGNLQFALVSGLNDSLAVSTNDTKMIIKPNGNVGIGTVSPNYTLQVNGSFAASSKNFDIPDPSDPLHKRLIHSTLEGPEIAVFYRGEGQLINGRALIALPDYFEVLTRKEGRTVLLTAKFNSEAESISELAASSVSGGRFTVRAVDDKNPGQPFYWEVKAVRADLPILQAEKPAD